MTHLNLRSAVRCLTLGALIFVSKVAEVQAGDSANTSKMRVHRVSTVAEIDQIRPTIVLVMAGFEGDGSTWCGDTNAALPALDRMKADPRFMWHTLAIYEAPYDQWNMGKRRDPMSKAAFRSSHLNLWRVPTLAKYKDPTQRLVEWDIVDDYSHVAYLLLMGQTQERDSENYLKPIQLTVNFVFKDDDVSATRPDAVYFTGVYNPGYGKSWSKTSRKALGNINRLVTDPRYKGMRLTVVSIIRKNWNAYEFQYGPYRLRSEVTMCSYADNSDRIDGYQVESYREIQYLLDRVQQEKRRVENKRVVVTTPEPTTTSTEAPTTTAKTTTAAPKLNDPAIAFFEPDTFEIDDSEYEENKQYYEEYFDDDEYFEDGDLSTQNGGDYSNSH